MFGSLESLIHSLARLIKNNLVKQYMKIYGTNHVTNNELYICLVRGWPTSEINGHKANWTKTILLLQNKKQDV
jgi:hypothetical protein